MASINSRRGKLFVDFRYAGQRCREYTSLSDTNTNRKKLAKLAEKIDQEISLGTFDYERYFPGRGHKVAGAGGEAAKSRGQRRAGGNPTTPSLRTFYEQWRDEMAPTWRQTYIESIERTFQGHVFPFFEEEREVGDIRKEDIHAFRAHLGKGRPESKRELSASTINRTLKILRMMLEEAADRFQFKSPFVGVKLLKEQKHHIEPFSLDEIQLILHHVRSDLRNYFVVRFFTGMRSGEAHGLKWKNVDFDRNEILVRETYVDGRTEYTKNDGSQREIAMSSRVRDALAEQHKVTGHFEYVFATAKGAPMDNHNMVNRVWAPLLRYLDIPYRRPYTMRHTAATLWLAAGESPEWIARQLGHTSTEMLFKTYSRYVPNATRQDGSAMDRLLQTQLNVQGVSTNEQAGGTDHD